MNAKIALHNLDFFEEWMEELHEKLHSNRIGEMLSFRAMFPGHQFIKDMKRILPGLYK